MCADATLYLLVLYSKPSQSSEGGYLREFDVPLFSHTCVDRIAGLLNRQLNSNCGIDGRWGRGYEAITPSHLDLSGTGPWCTALSPARHLQRRSTPCEKLPVNLACDSDFHVNLRVLLHAANLHGTDDFTSPQTEGMLRIFSPEKSDGFGRVRTRDLGYQRPAC
jgi:hypothetical protein